MEEVEEIFLVSRSCSCRWPNRDEASFGMCHWMCQWIVNFRIKSVQLWDTCDWTTFSSRSRHNVKHNYLIEVIAIYETDYRNILKKIEEAIIMIVIITLWYYVIFLLGAMRQGVCQKVTDVQQCTDGRRAMNLHRFGLASAKILP